ncbi:Hypothetical protein GQ85_023 [Rhodococcus rhodochrous]|uniref:Uncharacterized protein n=1 Tax=Microbacterium sp. MA1 TaxID=614068 RepID=C3UMX6_9MICO|nr:conserved hypothetical protein [Microbacterium sp. MA1]ART90638.1 conserved hypothetical protein [Rhodococcus rhodochrous]OOL33125.1 Hypothetical protein GQ85_023 [Rhodococcus rhodochrous]
MKLAVRTVGDSRTLVLICATRPSRRPEPPTDLHDALKDEAYLLTGQASVGEHLRTAAELAKWHGARLVTTTSEHGSPVPVLQRVAARVGAGAVFIGSDGPRPGWTPRRLGARLDRGVELIVTDGAVHHRRRTAIREVSEPRVSWPASWPAPGLATH